MRQCNQYSLVNFIQRLVEINKKVQNSDQSILNKKEEEWECICQITGDRRLTVSHLTPVPAFVSVFCQRFYKTFQLLPTVCCSVHRMWSCFAPLMEGKGPGEISDVTHGSRGRQGETLILTLASPSSSLRFTHSHQLMMKYQFGFWIHLLVLLWIFCWDLRRSSWQILWVVSAHFPNDVSCLHHKVWSLGTFFTDKYN